MSVLATVAAERVHSAIDRVWTVEQERSYLELLSPREVIYVAVNERSEIVGLQILDRWSSIESMAHVGQVGTFLLPATGDEVSGISFGTQPRLSLGRPATENLLSRCEARTRVR